MKRLAGPLLAGVGLILAGGVALWALLASRPQPAAVVASSTPRSQHGYTLAGVTYVSGPNQGKLEYNSTNQIYGKITLFPSAYTGTTCVWIRLPGVQAINRTAEEAVKREREGQRRYTVTGKASTGETFRLPWRLESGSAVPFLMASIPPGYPDTFRYVDVTLKDIAGKSATWRIERLPKMRHLLAPPVAVVNAFRSGGITVTAQATRDHRLHGVCLHVTLPPDAPHRWDMAFVPNVLEWMPPEYDEKQPPVSTSTYDLGSAASVKPEHSYYNSFSISGMEVLLFPQYHHYVRTRATLRQYETYDEKVVFPGATVQARANRTTVVIPRDITVTTPSGVRVTLLAGGISGSIHYTYTTASGSFYPATISLRLEPDGKTVEMPVTLPGSPLAKRYGKPVSLQIVLPKPYRTYSWSGDTIRTICFMQDKPGTLRPAPLTVLLRHRVDLQTYPMTFTVPIENQPTAAPKKTGAHP